MGMVEEQGTPEQSRWGGFPRSCVSTVQSGSDRLVFLSLARLPCEQPGPVAELRLWTRVSPLAQENRSSCSRARSKLRSEGRFRMEGRGKMNPELPESAAPQNPNE